MNRTALLVLAVAGGTLLWIALRTDDPTYQAPVKGTVVGTVPFEISGEIPAGMVVRSFDVTGMCCEGCEGKLYQSLSGVPGVERAAVDFVTASAHALVPEDSSDDLLLAALTFEKYEAKAP